MSNTRTHIITGAGSGIGRALADRLSARGDRVIGVDLRGAEVTCDLADPAQRERLIEDVTALSGGHVDTVAAVAGIATATPVTAAINYFGAVDLLTGLRPLLARSTAPRAAVVASFAALGPTDDALVAALLAGDADAADKRSRELLEEHPDGSAPLYGSSKFAVTAWVRRNAPSEPWAGAGIALNAVAPGVVATPLMAQALSTDEGRAAVAELVPSPLNGPAPAAAPAGLLAWLLSEENTHVTGQVVFIDGGAEALSRGARF